MKDLNWKKRKILLSKLKRKLYRNIWLARGLFYGGLFVLLFGIAYVTSSLLSHTAIATYVSFARNFLFGGTSKVNSFENKVNVVVLGKGGQGHEGPDLTDTIIFTSVDLAKPRIVLVSLPRDIWVPALRAKLNSAYYWGNQKQAGGGVVLVKSTVEEIVGKPIHYAVVVDFDGFIKLIDVLEGVEVNVQNSFVDEKYPIPGREDDDCDGDREYKCRYETVKFEKGVQQMNGETALKFVRSRNAEGDEGTDIARAARQQEVLKAVKNKVLSAKVVFSPKKINGVIETLRSSIETDMPENSLAVITRRLFEARNGLQSFVLPSDLLVNPPISQRYDYQYVFVPDGGNWLGVHKWVNDILTR